MICEHDINAREVAVTADGYCPLCMEADLDEIRAACRPFLRFYEDIRFNLRKQPHPTDAAISESGERSASISWAELYRFHAVLTRE